MRIPPYWAKGTYSGPDGKGRTHTFWAWGWSFDSRAEARKQATARARRISDLLSMGTRPDSYDYVDRPLKEEIVQPVRYGDDEIALITRNSYGVLVLNCTSVCFVDVDFPKVRSRGMLDTVLLLLSPKRRRLPVRAGQEATVQTIIDWAERNPMRSFRMYRTLAGLRLLFTDRLYDPKSDETAGLLKELGSDPLYSRLTLNQECFRARLTPKPWRCGCRKPPNRYPWDTPDAEQAYRKWQGHYEAKSEPYTACHLIDTWGDGPASEHIGAIMSLHDRYACCAPEVKLA